MYRHIIITENPKYIFKINNVQIVIILVLTSAIIHNNCMCIITSMLVTVPSRLLCGTANVIIIKSTHTKLSLIKI